MRNLKKLLALVLAMVMAFSLMLSASAANGDYDKYSDKETITEEFQTAVNVLSGLDVLKGDGPDDAKTFRPADTLTRAEAAVIVYRVATGDVKDQQTELYKDYATFKDMSHDDWFAGYVGFCQNAGYIKGTSPTTFSPYEKVSGYQLLAMLLRVIGYGKNNEFVGNTWMVNTAALAEQLHITDTVKAANFANTLKENARRDVVAELTFRTINDVYTVTYTPALGYSDNTNQLTGGNLKNPTQAYKIFRLVRTPSLEKDTWGRPNDTWWCENVNSQNGVYNSSVDTPVAVITWKPVAEYNTAKYECDIIHDNTDWSKDKDKSVTSHYINGVGGLTSATNTVTPDRSTTPSTGDNVIEALGTTNVLGAQGRILEIYDMTKSYRYGVEANGAEDGARIVEIDTWLGRVAKVTAAGKDMNDHPTKATIDVDVYPGGSEIDGRVHSDETAGCPTGTHTLNTDTSHHDTWDFNGVEAEGFNVGDYVLVYINQNTTDRTHNAESFVTNKWSIANNASATKKVVDGQDNITKAEIKAGGFVYSWTDTVATSDKPDTTTVGTTEYKDAAKFCANWRVQGRTWSVAVDHYGNAIGLVSLNSYLAIEKMEWKHGSAFDDDFALADVLTAGGEKISGVKIRDLRLVELWTNGSTVDEGIRVMTNTRDANGSIDDRTVSDYYTNNREYYQHVFEYAVNEDGTYSLSAVVGRSDIGSGVGGARDDNRMATGGDLTRTFWGVTGDAGYASGHFHANSRTKDLTGATVARGQATIYGNNGAGADQITTTVNAITATNATVFAVLNADGFTYTVYTGKDNVPTVYGARVCAQIGDNGYATFVLIKGQTVAENRFWGYVGDVTRDTTNVIDGVYMNGYNIYKLGETTPTTVYAPQNVTAGFVDAAAFAANFTGGNGTGFYEFTVNDKNVVTTMTEKMADGSATAGADALAPNNVGGNIATTWHGGMTLPNGTGVMERVGVTNVEANGSFMAGKYTTAPALAPLTENGYTLNPGTADKDFRVESDTKIIVVEKSQSAASLGNGGFVTLREGTVEDIKNNAIAWVAYQVGQVIVTGGVNQRVYSAKAVYVLHLANDYSLAKACTTEDWVLENQGKKVVEEPDNCYYATMPTSEDSVKEALRQAVAHAKDLKLSELTANAPGGNLYNFTQVTGATGGRNYAMVVFNNKDTITYERFIGERSYNIGNNSSSTWNNRPLSVGNYIVVATTPALANPITGFNANGIANVANTTATHFVAFRIV